MCSSKFELPLPLEIPIRALLKSEGVGTWSAITREHVVEIKTALILAMNPFVTLCVAATICSADERVSGNACVACSAGTINAAGDDASGADTTCDGVCLCACGLRRVA